MDGDMSTLVLQWRDEVERGDRQGPRIATCGPKLDGPKPVWPGSLAVTTPEEARAAARKVNAMGPNFVKVYHGLSPESLKATAEEAKRQQLRLTGHPVGMLLDPSRRKMKQIDERRPRHNSERETGGLRITRCESLRGHTEHGKDPRRVYEWTITEPLTP